MAPRSLPEWIGRSPDARVPAHVRLRIFDAHGERCHLTGRKIHPGDSWELDHIIALVNGGEHRESNLAPALISAHRAKTRADVAEKARVARKRKAHLGITSRKHLIPGSVGTGIRKPINGPAYFVDEVRK